MFFFFEFLVDDHPEKRTFRPNFGKIPEFLFGRQALASSTADIMERKCIRA